MCDSFPSPERQTPMETWHLIDSWDYIKGMEETPAEIYLLKCIQYFTAKTLAIT